MIDIDAWCAAHDVPPVIDGPEVFGPEAFDGGDDRSRLVGEWSQRMDPEASVMHRSLRDQVRKAMVVLGERERFAVLAAFGFDDAERDLEATAEKFGITRSRVRQLEKKAVQVLRHPKRIVMFMAWRDECIECDIRERRIRKREYEERLAAIEAATKIERMRREDDAARRRAEWPSTWRVDAVREDRKPVAPVGNDRTSPRPVIRDSLRPYFEATVRGMR